MIYIRSRSYIYVIEDSATLSANGIHKEKLFATQEEVMARLTSRDGGVSEAMTLEAFDQFPVVKVEPYTAEYDFGEAWLRTKPGKIVFAVLLTFIIIVVIAVVVCYELKRANPGR